MIIKINNSVSGGDNITPYEGCENRQIESDRDGYDKLFNTTDEYKAYFQRREGSLNRHISNSSENLLDSDTSRKLKRKTLSCSDLLHTLKGDVSIYPDGDIDFTRAAHDIDFSKRKTASLQDILSSYDVEHPKSDVDFSRSVSWSNTLCDYEEDNDVDEFDDEDFDHNYDDYSRKCVDFDQKRQKYELNSDDYNHKRDDYNPKKEKKQSNEHSKLNHRFRQKRHHRTLEQLQALINNQKELISKRKENEDGTKKKNKKGLKGLNIQNGCEKKKNSSENDVCNIKEDDDRKKRGRNVQKEVLKLEKNVIDKDKYVEIMQRCKNAEKQLQGKMEGKNDDENIDDKNDQKLRKEKVNEKNEGENIDDKNDQKLLEEKANEKIDDENINAKEEQKVPQEKKKSHQQKRRNDEEKIHLKEQLNENKLLNKEKVYREENAKIELRQNLNDKNNENNKNNKEKQKLFRENKPSNHHEIANDEEKTQPKEQLKENEVHGKENKVNTNKDDKQSEIRDVGNDPVDLIEEIIECRQAVPSYEVNENILADTIEESEKKAEEERGKSNVDQREINAEEGRGKSNVEADYLDSNEINAEEERGKSNVEAEHLDSNEINTDEGKSEGDIDKSEQSEDECKSKKNVSHLIEAFECGKQQERHSPVLPVIAKTSEIYEKSQKTKPIKETIDCQETIPDFAINDDKFDRGNEKGGNNYNINVKKELPECENEKSVNPPLMCIEPVTETIECQEIIPEYSINDNIFDIMIKRSRKEKLTTAYKDNILCSKNMFYNAAPVEHGLLPVLFEKPTVLFGKLTVRSGKPTILSGNPAMSSEKPAIKPKRFADTFRKAEDETIMNKEMKHKEITPKRDPLIKPVDEVIECYNILPNFTVDENIFDMMDDSGSEKRKPERLSPAGPTHDDSGLEKQNPERVSHADPTNDYFGSENRNPERLSTAVPTHENDLEINNLLNANEEFPRVVWSLNEEGIVHCEIDYQTKHIHDGIEECDQAKLSIPFDNTIETEIIANQEIEVNEEEFVTLWTHKDSHEHKDKEEIVVTQSIADRIRALLGRGQNTAFIENKQNQSNKSMKNEKESSKEKNNDKIFSKNCCMSPKDRISPFPEIENYGNRINYDSQKCPKRKDRTNTNLPKDDNEQEPNKNSQVKTFPITDENKTRSSSEECYKHIEETGPMSNQFSNRKTDSKIGSEQKVDNDIERKEKNSTPKQQKITENDSTNPKTTTKANIRKFNLIIENDLIKPDSISELNTCNPDSILGTDVTIPNSKTNQVVRKPDLNSKTVVERPDPLTKSHTKEPDSTTTNPKTDSISKPKERKLDFTQKSHPIKPAPSSKLDTKEAISTLEPNKQKHDSSVKPDLRKLDNTQKTHPILFDPDVERGRLPTHEHYKRLQLNFLNNIEELKLTLSDFSATLSNSLNGLKTKKELLESEFSYAYGQEVKEKSVQTENCFYTGVDFV